jgi:hypothetical protein
MGRNVDLIHIGRVLGSRRVLEGTRVRGHNELGRNAVLATDLGRRVTLILSKRPSPTHHSSFHPPTLSPPPILTYIPLTNLINPPPPKNP